MSVTSVAALEREYEELRRKIVRVAAIAKALADQSATLRGDDADTERVQVLAVVADEFAEDALSAATTMGRSLEASIDASSSTFRLAQ